MKEEIKEALVYAGLFILGSSIGSGMVLLYLYLIQKLV